MSSLSGTQQPPSPPPSPSPSLSPRSPPLSLPPLTQVLIFIISDLRASSDGRDEFGSQTWLDLRLDSIIGFWGNVIIFYHIINIYLPGPVQNPEKVIVLAPRQKFQLIAVENSTALKPKFGFHWISLKIHDNSPALAIIAKIQFQITFYINNKMLLLGRRNYQKYCCAIF